MLTPREAYKERAGRGSASLWMTFSIFCEVDRLTMVSINAGVCRFVIRQRERKVVHLLLDISFLVH